MKPIIQKNNFSSKQKRISKKLLLKIFCLMQSIDTKIEEYINNNEEDLEKLIKNSLSISKVIPDLLKASQLLLPVVENEEFEKKNYLMDIIKEDSETMELVEKLIMKFSKNNTFNEKIR
jgi:hypothetical protein